MRPIDGDRLKRKVQRIATEAWMMKLTASVESVLNQFIDYLNEAPTIDVPTWIPCSERPPEEEGEYLVTVKKYAFDSSYYDVQIAYCSPNKKWFHISNCEIVAWMPRPNPWKGADDGNK